MEGKLFTLRHLFILLALVCHVSRAQNVTTNSSTTTSTTTTTTTAAASTTTASSSSTASSQSNKDNKCLNGGTTTLNQPTTQCQCVSGFFGDVCQYVACGKDNQEEVGQCLNEGVCWEHYETKEPFCKCKPTYKGALCESPVCQDYCMNNGICDDGLGDQYDFDVVNTTDSVVAKPTCTCRPRYRGSRCQFDNCHSKVDPTKYNCFMNGTTCEYKCGADCDQAYCMARGRCATVSDSTRRLICQCQFGYSGPNCNINACDGYCFNNGTCSTQNNTLSCQCSKEFSGHRCSKPVKVDDESGSGKSGSKLKSFIYGLTLTIAVCMTAVGAYYLVQKGYFRDFNPMSLFNKSSSSSSSSSASPSSSSGGGVRSFFRANLGFNKLEDEQIITQNEEGIDNL